MTSPRVQRHRKAEAARRRVRTQGKRVSRPRTPKTPARRSKYRKSLALSGLAVMFSGFSFMTGSIFWAIGAVASAGGAAVAHRIEYRRELAEVKRTGQPIGAKPKAGDPLPAGVTPVDLDAPRRAARPKPAADAHMARCKAKPPGGPTCRCPDGPNRKGKPKTATKRASGGARRKT